MEIRALKRLNKENYAVNRSGAFAINLGAETGRSS
jgi:hypothetical protein